MSEQGVWGHPDHWRKAAEGWQAQTDREVALREQVKAERDLFKKALRMACEAGGVGPTAATAAMKLYVNAASKALALEEEKS